MSKLPTGPTKAADDSIPRSWSDTSHPVIQTDAADPVGLYVDWLATHLLQRSIPFSSKQRNFFLPTNYLDWASRHAPQGVLGILNESLEAISIVEASHKAGETWDQFFVRQKQAFLESNSGSELGWNFETEWCCERVTYDLIGEEILEQQQNDPVTQFPDIPYRAYLSAELRAHFTETAAKDYLREILSILSRDHPQN